METTNTILKESSLHVSTKPIISIRGLKIAFGSNVVLDGFNLDLNKGESIVVLGKSGSGKSVLIKCIIGLLTPDAGEVLIFGEDVLKMNHYQLDQVRARLGFLFQSNALYDSMTVKENLEFPLRRHWIKIDQKKVEEMVIEALTNVGLAHTVNMMPSELSGGMRKRIALARTLILRPEVILYDEPTTGLDPVTGKEISELMVEIADHYQTSAIVISHDMRCVRRTAERIAVLINGKCYAQGTYDELKKSTDILIKQFFDT
jgi:phospholipid/cholesterol/gamma-HCH transport system ATP-binding protein